MAWNLLLKIVENPDILTQIVMDQETAVHAAIRITDEFLNELNKAELKRTGFEPKKRIEHDI